MKGGYSIDFLLANRLTTLFIVNLVSSSGRRVLGYRATELEKYGTDKTPVYCVHNSQVGWGP